MSSPAPLASTGTAPTELAEPPPAPRVDPELGPLDSGDPAQRYEVRALLGAGGMGEVHLCHDQRIGRDVAMKIVRTDRSEAASLRRRFEREARVQAQLEHPSVVPVYDLGIRPDGAAFFTMKRVRGMSLDEVVGALRSGNEAALRAYSRRRLLTAFSSVCLAVAFAHARGVVHRDLKPANVMLGEFGEVNVLDWGVAKIAAAPDADVDPASRIDPKSLPAGVTAEGAVLGTPGYMAPEQIRGEQVDARADIYALGAILFELLALEPLHRGTSAPVVLVSTLTGTDARPSARAPSSDIAPELDAICVRATSLSREDRFANAREMSEAIERFLDGDRDVERRRELAGKHAEAAASAATSDRATAIREASLALALDPKHERALETLLRLLLEAPEELSPEAAAELERRRAIQRKHATRVVVPIVGSLLALGPFMAWQGIRNVWLFIVQLALFAAVALMNWWASKQDHLSRGLVMAGIVGTFLIFTPMCQFYGPLVLLPSVTVAVTLLVVLSFGADPGVRNLSMLLGTLAILAPLALELLGALPRSYVFGEAGMIVTPHALALREVPTLTFLALSNVGAVVLSASLVGRRSVALANAERRLFAHAWHLRQFVPDQARDAAKVEPGRASRGASIRPKRP